MIMFDTTIIRNEGPSKIDVVEKKASTDASIALLNEFQNKAFDNIVSHVQLETNDLKDIRWWSYPDQYSFEDRIRVRFKLNSRIIDFTFKPPGRDCPTSEIGQRVLKEVSDKIAKELFVNLVTDQMGVIREIYKR